MAPPFVLLSALLRVKPEMLVVTVGSKMLKILNKGVPGVALRRRVSRFAPGPWNVKLLSRRSWPEVSVIGPAIWLVSKVMVLPGQALLMIVRSDPAPLSLPLVTSVPPQFTVIVAV